MQKYQYTSVDTILAKHYRDLRGIEINESDAIEWIGEALGFMKMPNIQEEAIAFIEVKNYQCQIPNGLHYIIQIGLDNDSVNFNSANVLENLRPQTECIENGGDPPLVVQDCQGNIQGDYAVTHFRPYFDLQYEYFNWNRSSTYRERYSPVRLANHTFFNTLVCQDEGCDVDAKSPYLNCDRNEEYTIVGDQLRFSFKEGIICVAYARQKVDAETGYPMVPDDESCKAAIKYYISWRIFERMCYLGRANACQLSEREEQRWLKYVNQFKNKTYMPTGVDQYQNLMEQSRYLIPRFNRYYGFFGKLGKKEDRPFNNPDRRNKRYTTYLGYDGG